MRVAEFGSLFKFIRNGMSVKQDKSGDGLPITRIETIADATIDSSRVGYAGVSEEDGARWLLEPGDILFSHINSVEHVGKCAIYRGIPEKLVHGMNLLCMRCDQTQLLPEFATYLIRSPGFRARLQNFINKAVNQASVSIGNLKPIPVGIPSLPEQRRIATILDQADALRAKRREALAQLDSLTQSIFIDMFGDPVRNERSWPTNYVSELCTLVRGSSPRPQGDPRFFDGPVPRLMVADITRDGWLVTPKIDSLTLEGAKRSRPVRAGTVVMAVSGNIGLVSRLAIDACVHDGFVAFTELNESKCEPGFFLALLHFSKAAHEKSKAGAIFINLTTSDIKAMAIPLPPMKLQREFSHRINSFNKLRSTAQTALNTLDALFASLQHRAFRGEL